MELSKINQPEGLFNWLRRNFTSPFPLQEIVGDGSFQFSHQKTLFLLIWSPNHGTLMTPTPWHFLPALWRSPPRSGKGEGTTEWHFSICVGMIDGPIRYQRVLSCPDQRRTSCARDIPLSAFTSQFQGQLKENVASFFPLAIPRLLWWLHVGAAHPGDEEAATDTKSSQRNNSSMLKHNLCWEQTLSPGTARGPFQVVQEFSLKSN